MSLREEDGARFVARLTELGTLGIRASCWAERDYRAGMDLEMPDHQVFMTEVEARKWVREVATWRGFQSVEWRA